MKGQNPAISASNLHHILLTEKYTMSLSAPNDDSDSDTSDDECKKEAEEDMDSMYNPQAPSETVTGGQSEPIQTAEQPYTTMTIYCEGSNNENESDYPPEQLSSEVLFVT